MKKIFLPMVLVFFCIIINAQIVQFEVNKYNDGSKEVVCIQETTKILIATTPLGGADQELIEKWGEDTCIKALSKQSSLVSYKRSTKYDQFMETRQNLITSIYLVTNKQILREEIYIDFEDSVFPFFEMGLVLLGMASFFFGVRSSNNSINESTNFTFWIATIFSIVVFAILMDPERGFNFDEWQLIGKFLIMLSVCFVASSVFLSNDNIVLLGTCSGLGIGIILGLTIFNDWSTWPALLILVIMHVVVGYIAYSVPSQDVEVENEEFVPG